MGDFVAKLKLPYTCREERNGVVTWYVRRQVGKTDKGRPKFRKVKIDASEDQIATAHFLSAYNEALAKFDQPPPEQVRIPSRKGTMRHLIERYMSDMSSPYQELSARTQYVYRGILDKIRDETGEKSVAGIKPKHVLAGRNKRRDTPAQANSVIKVLRVLFDYGISIDLATENPAAHVKKLAEGADGFYTWTRADHEAYEAHHPVGTMARLCYDLFRATGQRLGDIAVLGPQHETITGHFYIRQRKTGAEVEILIPDWLRQSIAATPHGDMCYVINAFGKPFSDAGLSNRMRKWCDEAGLEHCSAHGLRKSAASRLAESGASANEIAAVTGHSTLKEVSRYTKKAELRRMSDQAIKRMEAQKGMSADVIPLKRKAED